MDVHSIIFSGDINEGQDVKTVKESLSRLFKISDVRKVEQLFSGRPVTLKKNLNADQARRYQSVIEQAGARCVVDPPFEQTPAVEVPFQLDPESNSDPDAGGAGRSPLEASEDGSTGAAQGLSLMPIEPPADQEDPPAPGEINPKAEVMPAGAATSTSTGLSAASSRLENARRYGRGAMEASLGDNSSGAGSAASVPSEAGGLCWGGFLMGWIWGIGNNTFIALATLIPVVGFAVQIYLLIKGRELAWRNKRWRDVEHFSHVQRRWTQVGLVLLLGILLLYYNAIGNVEDQLQAAMTGEVSEADKADIEKKLQEIEDPRLRDAMRQLLDAAEQARKNQN